MMQHRKFELKPLVLILISISLLLSATFANGAKLIQDTSGNGGLIFDENPGITLLNETISFNLKDSTYMAQANVTVEYEMKNLLEQNQSFDMFFVVPSSGGYESTNPSSVILNGVDITKLSYYKTMRLPSNWKPSLPQDFFKPNNKERYKTHFEGDTAIVISTLRNELDGIIIPISIKANSTAKLLIQYPCEGGYNNLPIFHNTIYNYMYYLTPAKFWNQEPQVTVNVALPDTKHYAVHSSIPMEKVSESSYTAKLDSLPDSEWIFSFVDKEGLIYGTNSSRTRTLITLFISFVFFIIGLLATRRYKSRIYTKLGYILAVAYFYIFKGNIVDGYIGEFILMIPISLVIILIIPIAYHVYYRHKVANKSITRG